jgi:DNA-binding beta-propeller fold protein YncE
MAVKIRRLPSPVRSRFVLVAILLAVCALLAESQAPALRQAGILDLPGAPGFDQVVFARGILMISHGAAGTVDLFDPRKRRLIGRIRQMSSPRGIAVDEPGKLAYIANAGARSIVVVSTEDWQVRRTIALEDEPEALLLDPARRLLYVALPRSNTIAALDLASGRQAARVKLDGRPCQFAYDSRRARIYLTVQDRRGVLALSPGLETISRWTLDASEPTGVVFSPQNDRLYVAVRYAVIALDPESGREVARAPVAGGIDQLALSEAEGSLLGAAEGSVFVLPTSATLGEANETAVGVRAHTFAYDPATGTLFLPGGLEGRSKLLLLKRIER